MRPVLLNRTLWEARALFLFGAGLCFVRDSARKNAFAPLFRRK